MIPVGPTSARILILADWPDPIEAARQSPLSSYAADEFNKLLHEAGLTRGECLVACLSSRTAPQVKGKEDLSAWVSHTKNAKGECREKLHSSWVCPELDTDVRRFAELVRLVQPTVIIALGSLALYALTGVTSVKKWRGSQLHYKLAADSQITVIPTYAPRYLQRDFSVRAITALDLKRAARVSREGGVSRPVFDFLVRPSFAGARASLAALHARVQAGPIRISIDIETRAGHMACIGFATDKRAAFCIPLMCAERAEGYWSHLEETMLVMEMREIMTHPNALCFGQNFLYDVQYIYRFWMCLPNIWYDTMIAQHVMFPGQPKGLDYLASMYCEHYVYWKDDGKTWDEKTGEDQLWTYNCEDCVRTYECMEAQWPALDALGVRGVWDFQQNTLFPLLLKAMNRGVRCDVADKARLSMMLMGEITQRETDLTFILGHPINIKSPKQMMELFYDDLKIKPIFNRATGKPTLDDKALSTIARKEPLLQGVCNIVSELRSLGVFRSTFVEARLDSDRRLRSSYNISGTETFRLSSSENAFGSGLNFQNVPKGDQDSNDPTVLVLPNIRKLFIPDQDFTMFDMDLKSADFYTVVWEADDEEFRDALDSGIDMHGLNAKNLFGLSCGANEVKDLHGGKRQLAKIWCHATNYGAGARNMAIACGITIHEAERLRRRWFQAHPGIEAWHRRVERELHQHRRVSNAFGYRYIFFDRIDAALPEALAWGPQSTTGCVINRAWANIDTMLPEVEVLIQVHDSLVGQYRTEGNEDMPERILAASRVVVPYAKPLIIPSGIKTSTISWGHCE